MSLSLVTSLWAAMKPMFASSDRPEAAEVFVNALIDNDFDPKELKKAFKKDGNILNALGLHVTDDFGDEDDDESFGFDDYEDYEDEDY